MLASKLHTDRGVALNIESSLDADLSRAVDALVVRRRVEVHVVGGLQRSGGAAHSVAEGGRVAGHGRLLDIVADLAADEEALVAGDGIDDGLDRTAFGVVEEGAGVEARVGLEGQVELLADEAVGGGEEVDALSLEPLRKRVVKLDLGGEHVGGREGLGDGHACVFEIYQPCYHWWACRGSWVYGIGEERAIKGARECEVGQAKTL